ncbi:uncharacterized protein Dwil_GK19059 [Drosophila willistoni]|uniref:Cytochrome b5 heme-binding domain-containing protein n=1 Tax=Drosophila willistoni TaxID=7260 RepID=B4MWG0_DROWI|nr:uncharacterized protein Dwil_GK19059 [Drosophila willistoni]
MPPRTNGFEDMSYLPFRRDFTVSELLEFDGTGRDGRILLAINFHVYDVSEARNSYGLDGMYANYAGRDISRNLINFSIETHGQDDFDDLSDLSLAQMNTLLEWDEQYKEKYPYVGRLIRNNEPHTNYADEEDDETEPETVENIQST